MGLVMQVSRADIIAYCKKEILQQQGFKTSRNISADVELGPIKYAFPNQIFPTGVIHEFISTTAEGSAASSGFVTGIVSALMKKKGISIWISAHRNIFPPALPVFGITPDNIIFIDLNREKDIQWVLEESLKCEGLAAVVAELPELNFTVSRRLQLAVEKSRVTGFILRHCPKWNNTTACVSTWQITSMPGHLPDGIPGVGPPRWNVNLVKVRNGIPGHWQIEWSGNSFRHIDENKPDVVQPHKKAV
jgi:protein ImuA